MARRLNIVHVCDHLGWEGSRMHGVKRLFAWMIPRFDPEHFNVSLISLRKKDLSEDTLEQVGIDVTYLHRGRFDPGTFQHLLKVIDEKKADVLHLHGYGATTFGRLVAWRRRLPVVLHEHANLTKTPVYMRGVDWALAPYTDIAIAVSQSTADFVTRARMIPEARTKVVYLGAPLEEFARPRHTRDVQRAREALGVPPGTFAVGTVTRLMPSKGNDFLVSAIALAATRLPELHCYIVGEGELEAALRKQAKDFGVEDRVTFTGFKRDVAQMLTAFDLTVFPSLWEGTPLTAFEARAMGKPIVSTDADGLKDILTHDVNAIIVPKRNAQALADAISAVAQNSPLRSRLALAARFTGEQYGIDRFVQKMQRLYEILHETSRQTKREGVLREDLSFLDTTPTPPPEVKPERPAGPLGAPRVPRV